MSAVNDWRTPSTPLDDASAIRIQVRKGVGATAVTVLPFRPDVVAVGGYPYGHEERFRPEDFAGLHRVTQLDRSFELAASAEPGRRIEFDIGPDVRWEDVLVLLASAQRGGVSWLSLNC